MSNHWIFAVFLLLLPVIRGTYSKNCLNVLNDDGCHRIQDSGQKVAREIRHISGIVNHLIFRCIDEADSILESAFQLLKQEIARSRGITETENMRVNVARGKLVEQSSTNWGGEARKAVDGHTNSDYFRGSCTHTNEENNPWLRIDLEKPTLVRQVVLFNRRDCCSWRLNNFIVTIGNNKDGVGNSQCGRRGGDMGSKTKVDVYCEPEIEGRYVHVKLEGRRVLTLCEVMVFEPGVNIAQGKPTAQSSNHENGLSSKAVDGNTNSDYFKGSCTHTLEQNDPWFRIDLGKPKKISQVVVFNRRDCCSQRLNNFYVTVGDDIDGNNNPQCGVTPGDVSQKHKIDVFCEPALQGRYVHIKRGGREALSLCEVMVFEYKGGSCPQQYPFSYYSGSYCCKFNKEKQAAGHGAICDGSLISSSSKCCFNDAYVKCPSKTCTNHRAVGITASWTNYCPASHPFSFLDGNRCCKHNEEGSISSQATRCDGGELSLTSSCCKNSASTTCNGGKCLNNPISGESTTWDSFCPKSHPHVYQEGKYCCAHDREGRDGKNVGCDGGLISHLSTCCLHNAYVPCYTKKCTSHWSVVAKAEKDLISTTARCISSTQELLKRANTNLTTITTSIFKDILKDDRTVRLLFGNGLLQGLGSSKNPQTNVDETIHKYSPQISQVFHSVELATKDKARTIFNIFINSLETLIGGTGDIDFQVSRDQLEKVVSEAAVDFIKTYVEKTKTSIDDAFGQFEVIDSVIKTIKDINELAEAVEPARILIQEAMEESTQPSNDDDVIDKLNRFCSQLLGEYKDIKATVGEIRSVDENQ